MSEYHLPGITCRFNETCGICYTVWVLRLFFLLFSLDAVLTIVSQGRLLVSSSFVLSDCHWVVLDWHFCSHWHDLLSPGQRIVLLSSDSHEQHKNFAIWCEKTPECSLVSSPKVLFLISGVQIQGSNWCLALLLCVYCNVSTWWQVVFTCFV